MALKITSTSKYCFLFCFLTHEVGQNSFGPTSHAGGIDVYQIIKIHTRNYVESFTFISVCILCEGIHRVTSVSGEREYEPVDSAFDSRISVTILFPTNW